MYLEPEKIKCLSKSKLMAACQKHILSKKKYENKNSIYLSSLFASIVESYRLPRKLINIMKKGYVTTGIRQDCLQWRSQPNNLVPLCKFQIIIIIHFFTK